MKSTAGGRAVPGRIVLIFATHLKPDRLLKKRSPKKGFTNEE